MPSTHSKVTITTSKGNDKAENFTSNDVITPASGQSISSATKKSDTEYVLNINKGKKVIGTLDVSGTSSTFTLGTDTSSSTNTKTGIVSTVTSYYVNVGGQQATYSMTTATSSTKSFAERPFEFELVDDNNLSRADDLTEITADTKINIDSSSLTFNDDSIKNNFTASSSYLTNNKRKDE